MTVILRRATRALAAGALLLAGGLAAVPARAQTPPAAPAAAPANITEASRREARLLGEKLGWESQVRSIINTLRTAIIVNLAQVNGRQPQDMIGVVDDVLIPDFVGDAASLHTLIVDAWAGAFTADELRNLRNFYSSPLGDKLLRTLPQLNSAINLAGQNWAQKIFQVAQTKHAEEFAKRGLKFSQ